MTMPRRRFDEHLPVDEADVEDAETEEEVVTAADDEPVVAAFVDVADAVEETWVEEA